jgi:PPOX class probable F420-dependent enzyme
MLRAARVGRLATADAAGRPLVVPVCYAYDGDAVYPPSTPSPSGPPAAPPAHPQHRGESVRLAVVDEYDEDWTRLRYVIVEGRATVLTGGELFGRAVDTLRAKYPQYRAMGLDRAAGFVIAIAPARGLAWRFA